MEALGGKEGPSLCHRFADRLEAERSGQAWRSFCALLEGILRRRLDEKAGAKGYAAQLAGEGAGEGAEGENDAVQHLLARESGLLRNVQAPALLEYLGWMARNLAPVERLYMSQGQAALAALSRLRLML